LGKKTSIVEPERRFSSPEMRRLSNELASEYLNQTHTTAENLIKYTGEFNQHDSPEDAAESLLQRDNITKQLCKREAHYSLHGGGGGELMRIWTGGTRH
jgi:hypothetical protein